VLKSVEERASVREAARLLAPQPLTRLPTTRTCAGFSESALVKSSVGLLT